MVVEEAFEHTEKIAGMTVKALIPSYRKSLTAVAV